ncbi:nitroreductase [Aquimarina sp. AD1]|uniref:nitroreductase family protein n=1 Tax=Aquimarina sp. (strain AD1) TaxID=1714848 RepID=UPI000E516DDF|nr:nitroreductase [Aquimarina sp. AD1]AXT57901.1 nitroreductase [Aquimarina sp. AD1]RKN12290.1 nitroreductase [Aquimarina sp. AD1]
MNNEYLNQVIRERRAIFPSQYNNKPVSKEFIKNLLENANWAPTHRLTEPWRFKVVRGGTKDRLGSFLSDTYTDITPDDKFSPFKVKKIKDKCDASDTIIAICMQRDAKERVPEWEEIAATAMAVQNMWLTCASNNVGCYWSSPVSIKYADQFFELEEGERCLGFLYIGNYDKEDELSSKRNPVEEKVKWFD